MTGGSLGLRSGSYGSLQQQLHNHSPVPTALPIGSTPVSVRKNSKMLLPGFREKERRLSWIWKLASTRKVGMLLLLITSAAVVLSFFFALSKDVDQPSGPETVVGYSDHFRNLVNRGRIPSNYLIPPPAPVTEEKKNITLVVHDNVINETQSLLPSVRPMTIPLQHPCENFSLPPPPVDPKRTGPRLDLAMAYMPDVPSVSPVVKNLNYVSEENLLFNESNGGSIFGGHPSLQQREESFDVKESMTVYCGFAKGKRPGQGTGFDIDEADLLEMEQCRGVVVASAIFGNYDIMQQPKNISEASKRSACFYLFVDEETEASIKNSSNLNSTRKIGLWRVVVVRNLPYADARRNGKLLSAKGQGAIDAALKADLVVLKTAVAGKWLDPVLREHVPKVIPKILWGIHEMLGHYFKLEYVKHLPSVAGAMIDSHTTAEYWKNRTREHLGFQLPQTYVAHLGNSKELMKVAKDNVARRVLWEHIRESLGVRNDDLLFAIINRTSGEGSKAELNCKIEDVVNKCLHLNSRSVVYSCCVQHHYMYTMDIAGAGRCFMLKGQDLFFHSFHESLQLIQEQKLQVPSMHAVVVGSDMNAETKFEMELRDFVYKKGIQGHVHFVNKTLAVTPYLAAIDVLVQNSQARGECFGRITIEAMAFQLPALGTAAGGTTEIVVDGSTGLLHPVGKEGITPLAKNIVKLATHVERRLTMGTLGRKGYERVKERFMEHHMAERIAIVLKEVIQ